MLASILLPFLGALLAPFLVRRARVIAPWILALLPLSVFIYFASQWPFEAEQRTVQSIDWVPELGVHLAFALDGLSAAFALLITGIGAMILVYAGRYMRGDLALGRLLAWLLAFQGSMLGLVLSDDMIVLFVFWELTSITSYMLIGFKNDRRESREAARKALLVTGAGGLALLAGLLLLGKAGGELGLVDPFRISSLSGVALREHPLYAAAALLVLAGAFTKSAQLPFHFWLPGAMAAPTPVSAYLHSATMVKAGVYLVARLNESLGGTPLWCGSLIAAGAATMLAAALLATAQRDLKRLLAYSTVSVLGTLFLLIGIGSEVAIKAAMIYLVAHALYKAALFLVAGNIDHATGTRDLLTLGGLRRVLPWTATAAALAAFSQAGAPPLMGFLGKELLYKAKLDLGAFGMLLLAISIAANIFLVAVALVVALGCFGGERRETPRTPREASPAMLLGPLLLALAGLAVGLFPDFFVDGIGAAMAAAIAGHAFVVDINLWNGFHFDALLILGLSALTLLLGALLFRYHRPVRARLETALARVAGLGPERLYERGLRGLAALAEWHTRTIQHGCLRRYLGVVILVACALVAPALRGLAGAALETPAPLPALHELGLVALIAAGAALVASVRTHLVAIAGLGAVGLGVTLLFALYGAIDLAMTQVMVEALTVVLLVLVFHHLPRAASRETGRQRVGALTVALAGGALMSALVLASAAIHLDADLAHFFGENAVPEGKGRNVVNVILVDFRALDTLGESLVVAAAGIGIYGLLRLGRERRERGPS